MKLDEFSAKKRSVAVGNARVAYYEAGAGDALLLLHGCPFSSYIWRGVSPEFSVRRWRGLVGDEKRVPS